MKILSWNINGIRAVCKKGFLNWFRKSKPDILCLQEIKAQKEQMLFQIQAIKKSDFSPRPGWQCQTCDFKDICEFAAK